MNQRVYLVNPRPSLPTFFGGEVFEAWGAQPRTIIADLAVATVAAMFPADFDVRLCDETVTPIDFDTDAEVVGITGKTSQRARMREVALEFRRRGKLVVIGGPCASLEPEAFRDACDVLVVGETEEIFEQLCADLRGGAPKAEYQGTRPDLARTPIPRWDLYPNAQAHAGALQTSRGCPFECEFCDVIQYLGRKQRHKPIDSVLRELDVLYQAGYRTVFLCDDNFTVHRSRTKELLAALRTWNTARTDGHVRFTTQVSIDAARDEELIQMCAAAGMNAVFIGIETPNEESLRESKKRQNLRVDLAEEVQVFVDHGISVMGGMIVGFDADGPDIFQRQYDFAMSCPVPIFSVGALTAPAATPLYDRLQSAGRLLSDEQIMGMPWLDTNILPLRLTQAELRDGLHWLSNALYRPAAFLERVEMLAATWGRKGSSPFPSRFAGSGAKIPPDHMSIMRRVQSLGPEEEALVTRMLTIAMSKPPLANVMLSTLLRYAQIRHMFETGTAWNVHAMASPTAEASSRPDVPAASLVRGLR
jgi:radical SAM superfamily enzyme YgiQ (UPF0313 family)